MLGPEPENLPSVTRELLVPTVSIQDTMCVSTRCSRASVWPGGEKKKRQECFFMQSSRYNHYGQAFSWRVGAGGQGGSWHQCKMYVNLVFFQHLCLHRSLCDWFIESPNGKKWHLFCWAWPVWVTPIPALPSPPRHWSSDYNLIQVLQEPGPHMISVEGMSLTF